MLLGVLVMRHVGVAHIVLAEVTVDAGRPLGDARVASGVLGRLCRVVLLDMRGQVTGLADIGAAWLSALASCEVTCQNLHVFGHVGSYFIN